MSKKARQIKIATFLMISVPIIIISYVFVWENASQRKTAEIEKNVTIATAFAELIENTVEERKDHIVDLARMIDLEQSQHAKLVEILKSLKHSTEENYYITDTKGNVMVSSNYGWDKPQKIIDNPYFKQALEGETVVTPLAKSPLSGENVITIFTPACGVFSDSCMIGAIAAELPISFFKNILGPVTIGRSGRISLVDNRGNYIYDRRIDNITDLVESGCFLEAKGRNIAIVERESNSTNIDTVYTMIRFKKLGWYAVGLQPSADLTAPWLRVLTKNFIILVLILITVFVLWRYKASLEHRNQLVKQQRAEKLALVGELAAGMAHEIRNPLTAVKGFTQLLKSKEKYAEEREILDLIGSSVDHIEGIVRETLLLAKPQEIKKEHVNLSNLVEETYKFFGNEAVLKGLNLEMYCGGAEFIVLGDEIHLRQVLVNLIKNAIEAAQTDGRISMRLELTERSTALITVKDNGVGIKAADMDKIGTPFFTTKPTGTGLGLSVSKRIIEEHRGTFSIKSRQGKGTTVMIELPLNGTEEDLNASNPEGL